MNVVHASDLKRELGLLNTFTQNNLLLLDNGVKIGQKPHHSSM